MTQRELCVNSHWTSPYALIAFVALKEKGLAFTARSIALDKNEQRTTAFLETSGTGKIPCLIDGSFALTESTAIVDYLEDAYAFPNYPCVLPADVRDRARARQILSWLNSDFYGIREERSTQTIFYKEPVKSLSDKAQNDVERLLAFFRPMLTDGRKHLFADTWSVADAALAMMMLRLVHNRDAMPEWAVTYTNEQWKRESMQGFMKAPRVEMGSN